MVIVKPKPTLVELLQNIDEKTTFYDILWNYNWAIKERARLHKIAVERYRNKKNKKNQTQVQNLDEEQMSGSQEDAA